jgi:hypothetical protein
MPEEKEMIQLLREINFNLKRLVQNDTIRQIEQTKNLTFLFDRRTHSHWTSFNPLHINNTRLFGYFYSTAPDPVITDEGWYPLSIDENGKLKII